jgi:hypothetical protein
MNIPPIDLSGPPKTEAYLSFSKSEEPTTQIQSRSDSGLEAIISSHIHPSSTFGEIQQLSSVSSGFGSGILDSMTTKGYSLPDIQLPEPTLVPPKPNFTRQISLNTETRAKLIFRQNELKTCLEKEISKSIENFDSKKDQKSLDKILTHAIDLIKDKKVLTYPELKQKLIFEHKTEAFIVDPVVHSLYYTIENHELDNLDKPEFPLAIRDVSTMINDFPLLYIISFKQMVRLPAKQTYDTVTHLNKESASLSTTQMTKYVNQESINSGFEFFYSRETLPEVARSCLTCGRSKSKTKLPTTTTTMSLPGLLDERRRLQLNTHRNELGTLLRDHIQSSQPSIRQFTEHPKEVEKILRKNLILLTQPKTLSYEQIRHDLKTEYKQTYYLIDPIVDIIRDTLDHCDITQLNEKTNLDILDSNITQTANLYNHQIYLLNSEELNAFKSNQLSWLQSYLITNESKDKKITRKQTKELNKILHRTIEILSSNLITTWDELNLQLQREYPKAHDLCNRSIELLKQSQHDGLFHLQQPPPIIQDKRRASSLITEHARHNVKINRNQIILSFKNFLIKYNQLLNNDEQQLENYLIKTFKYLEEQKSGQFKSYQDLKEQLKKDFHKLNQDKLIEQIIDIIEQAHAINQFDDIEKIEVQTLMKDRLDGKPLIIKEMYVSLPPRAGMYGDDSLRYSSASTNGDRITTTTTSHRVARGLSWREANERARILFYRGKHPAIHYDEQAAAFDVRMLLETASGGTQEIPVTDSDVNNQSLFFKGFSFFGF